jgi:hypothetical protein
MANTLMLTAANVFLVLQVLIHSQIIKLAIPAKKMRSIAMVEIPLLFWLATIAMMPTL